MNPRAPLLRSPEIVIVGFAATVFLSAFLLFQVQPLLSKFILPWFGGGPAVWTAAMLFFQVVLFGGYLYAHCLSTSCSPRARLVIHLALLVLAAVNVAYSRLTPPSSLRPQGLPGESPLWQVLIILGVTVGLPYFVLSATGPLLQKWFHDALPGSSPYRLFALSNFGSLVALLSYPFFFEVYWGVGTQAYGWSVAYLIFAGCCAFCALRTWPVAQPPNGIETVNSAPATGQAVLRRTQYAYWLGLAMLASVMFLAVTNEVCQNVASVPLLWVVPLSLYLLSFIVAFDHPRWYSPIVFGWGTLLLLVLVTHYESCVEQLDSALSLWSPPSGTQPFSLAGLWWLQASCYFVALFAIVTLCHGELARSRPEPQHLTSFYLTISLGGALGGIFVNCAAPQLFQTFWEFPLGVMLTALAAAGLLIAAHVRLAVVRAKQLALSAVAGTLCLITLGGVVLDELPSPDSQKRTVFETRNFYGAVSVMQRSIGSPDENYTFYSGNTQHGKQYADAKQRGTPLTYYGAGSGCETAIRYAQGQSPKCRLGVIGLGAGTIATYARSTDSIRFYEINPEVVRIAGDTRWFHFLSDCQCVPEIVLGDARLQLERELREQGSQQFDVLVVDAFSADSVPTHLLTREAFGVYLQHLRPGGILALHITNNHLDLYPVASQLADHYEFGHRRIFKPGDPDRMLYRTYYVLISQDAGFLQATSDRIENLPEFLRRPRQVRMWTDDYTNLTSLLR